MDGSKCIQCGRCCKLKLWNPILGRYRLIGYPCPRQNEDGTCSVYDMRLAVQWNCITIEECAEQGLMPTDCPCMDDDYESLVDYEEDYERE